MRKLAGLVLLIPGSLTAQATLTTHYAANYFISSTTGGVYFDLVAYHDLSLDRIDLNLLSPPGTAARVEIYVRPLTWAGHVEGNVDWVLAAAGTALAAGIQQPSPCVLSRPVGLAAGGYGIAIRIAGAIPGLAFGGTATAFGNNDLRLSGSGAAAEFLASTPLHGRVFSGSLHYTLGGGPYRTATATERGAGCGLRARSFHEAFAATTFDLANHRLLLLPNANGGYDVVQANSGPITLAPNATSLGLTRGSVVNVTLPGPVPFPGGTTQRLAVIADGRVMLDGLNLGWPLPVMPGTLFSAYPTIAAAWQDYAPAGNANVYVATDAIANATTLTWWQVPVHGAPGTSNTFALTLRGDGTIDLAFATVDNPTSTLVCGFAAAAPALDPGPRDLSAAQFFSTRNDEPDLSLDAEGRPVLGTATRLWVRDIGSPAAAAAIGFAWPIATAVDLTPFGAPSCHLYLDPAATGWHAIGTARTFAFTIPPMAALLGVMFETQAAASRPSANALGLVTSNTVLLTVGSV